MTKACSGHGREEDMMRFDWDPTYTQGGLMLLQPNACCCGVATIHNVLRWCGIEITFDEVLDETEPYREDDGTMSMPDIWDFLEDYNFTLDGFVHTDILDAELAAGNIALIYVDARVLWGEGETNAVHGNHVLLATGKTDGGYAVLDTGSGKVAYNEEEIRAAMMCGVSIRRGQDAETAQCQTDTAISEPERT